MRVTTWLLLGVIGLAAVTAPGVRAESPPSAARQADLDWLSRRYQTAPVADAPDPQTLLPIVRELRTGPPVKLSVWQRLQQWLQRLAQPREQQAPAWLTRWIAALLHAPRWLRRLLLYSGVVVTAALTAALVWREVRIAWLDSRRARDRRDLIHAQQRSKPQSLSLRDVDAAPASEQPIWLLRLLIQTLTSGGLLRSERGLTHGELIAQAAFRDATQRQRFAQVARLAERRRYGVDTALDAPRVAHEREQTLLEGRQLYQQLVAQPEGPAS